MTKKHIGIDWSKLSPLDYKIRQCGVYCIRNIINNKVYIGSSINCYHRIRSQHLARLQRGTHTNPHLQSSWKRYGKKSFRYYLLEESSPSKIREGEQAYICSLNSLDSKFGYNINADTVSTAVLTEEQKRKITFNKQGGKRSDSTHKYVGVCRSGKKWMSAISMSGRYMYLGTFASEDEAAAAYDIAAVKMYGHKARTNLETKPIVNPRRVKKCVPILQEDSSGKIMGRFETYKQLAEAGFNPNSVTSCCRGSRKKCKGFTWKREHE